MRKKTTIGPGISYQIMAQFDPFLFVCCNTKYGNYLHRMLYTVYKNWQTDHQ